MTEVSAGAWIHRGDERDLRRKTHATAGSTNSQMPIFQRLAQGFENLAGKLRKFIEKEHALMGEADFSGARNAAPANQAHP